MRISGFASGLDIDSMVKELMTAQRAPLDKLNQQKQLTEWKRNDYRTVNAKIVSFQEKLNSLSLSSSIDAKKTNVTGTSGILTATATGAASNSMLNVEVKSLASASTVLFELKDVNNKDKKLSELITGYAEGQSKISVGDTEIEIGKDDTLSSLVSKINADPKSGVTAVLDSSKGTLSFTNKATGTDPVKFTVTGLEQVFNATPKDGSNATVIINGVTTTQTSNRFTVNGVDISLTGVSPTGQTTSIEIVQDTDKMFDTIKSFVDSYNDLLSLLNNKTNEERYRTYLPLTKEQKADMSEDEIKLWEEKAMSGMLKNDSILSSAISDMRTALFANLKNGKTINDQGQEVDVFLNLAQFGISTGSYTEKGKLVIDETKLRAAIASNPEDLMAMFKTSDLSASSDKFNETNGIFDRLKKISQDTLKSLSDRAGTSRFSSDPTAAFLPQSQMGNQIKDFDKRIADVNRRLTMLETRYYKQFTAMETAMNKYNSISSSLSSM